MSETVTEQEAQEALGRRRDPSSLREAAAAAFETMTAPAEGAEEEAPEVPAVPPPAQDPLTARNRQAAVEAAREAEQPAEPPADDTGSVPEPEAEVELPPHAPEDWLSEEPDYEAEARAQLDAEAVPDETGEEFDYEEDPRLREERIARIAAEKRLAHIESLRVQDARKGWVAEALEHAPLAVDLLGDNLEEIKATSKRAFLREAAKAHEKALKVLERRLGSATQIVAEETAAARAEAKRAAEEAYGRPTTGPGAAPASAAETAAKVAAAREQKGLRGAIRAMIDAGDMNP